MRSFLNMKEWAEKMISENGDLGFGNYRAYWGNYHRGDTNITGLSWGQNHTDYIIPMIYKMMYKNTDGMWRTTEKTGHRDNGTILVVDAQLQVSISYQILDCETDSITASDEQSLHDSRSSGERPHQGKDKDQSVVPGCAALQFNTCIKCHTRTDIENTSSVVTR